MRALIIDDDSKRKVQDVLDYAKEHYYVVENGVPVGDAPGNNPAFVAHIPVGYRCVFSFTLADGKLYRHLSISIPESGKYPNPIATYTIAQMFGFTGWDGQSIGIPDGWLVDVTQVDNCITLAQEERA